MRRASGAIAILMMVLATGFSPAWGDPDQPAGSANSYFISQMRDSTWNPGGPSWSTNCGPACLAMALKAFGRLDPTRPPQAVIHMVRRAMTGREDDFSLTSLDDIRSGAEGYGLATRIALGIEDVRNELSQGHLVILAGNPAAYNTRLSSTAYQAFSGPHFILVTGSSADGFRVNDPLSRRGSLKVSSTELATFMDYQDWDTGLAVWPASLEAGKSLLEAKR